MHLELISKFQVFQLPQITNQLTSGFHYIQAFNNTAKGAYKVVMVEMHIKQNYTTREQ
jgi:hypothetical protein